MGNPKSHRPRRKHPKKPAATEQAADLMDAYGGCLPCRNSALIARVAETGTETEPEGEGVDCAPSNRTAEAARGSNCHAPKPISSAQRRNGLRETRLYQHPLSVSQGRGCAKNAYVHKPYGKVAKIVGRDPRPFTGPPAAAQVGETNPRHGKKDVYGSNFRVETTSQD